MANPLRKIASAPTYFFLVAIIFATLPALNAAPNNPQSDHPRLPILIELFTSEGCSSCPPADTFLDKLDSVQPVPGAELIVLSEHVDYWNHDGWKDPFSSSFYTDRQGVYGRRFNLQSVYTPQMVVDGSSEFLGSDAHAAEKALSNALKVSKIAVHLTSLSVDPTNTLHAHIETDPLPESSSSKEADVYLGVALHHAESQVLRGENAGHHLAYTNVMQGLKSVGVLKRGQAFSQDVEIKLEPGADTNKDQQDLRFVAFVQDRHQGKVLGATLESIGSK
ncbi:MAG: DUF1223 domain-containing protein [Terriglobales bacterium]